MFHTTKSNHSCIFGIKIFGQTAVLRKLPFQPPQTCVNTSSTWWMHAAYIRLAPGPSASRWCCRLSLIQGLSNNTHVQASGTTRARRLGCYRKMDQQQSNLSLTAPLQQPFVVAQFNHSSSCAHSCISLTKQFWTFSCHCYTIFVGFVECRTNSFLHNQVCCSACYNQSYL